MTATISAPKKAKPSWAWRLGVIALIGVCAPILVGFAALTLARINALEKMTGFFWFVGVQPVVLGGGAIGVLALLIGLMRKSGPKWPALGAIAITLLMVATVYVSLGQYRDVYPSGKAMHDITTDVADPPAFVSWDVRDDNLVPFANRREWASAHRAIFPDIKPIVMEQPPAQVLTIARTLAEERDWEITDDDRAAGRIEAIAYAGYIRFRDHVVIEVTPINDGSTRVDMRSTSEVGRSDLSVNARRIREFLAAMASVDG